MDFESCVILLCGGIINKHNYWRSGERIFAAVNQFKSLENSCLLISSGISGHLKYGAKPESHVYYDYICKYYNEVSCDRIFIEDMSRDSVGNVFFSLTIAKLLLLKGASFFWVSNDFHMERIETIVSSLSDGGFIHNFVAVPSGCGIESLNKLKADERSSQERFKRDWAEVRSPEELLFLRHDFYRADRSVYLDEENSKCVF